MKLKALFKQIQLKNSMPKLKGSKQKYVNGNVSVNK